MKRVVVLGGTGFVGRALCRLLASTGRWQLCVPTRAPARAGALRVLPGLHLDALDVHDPAQLQRAIAGGDAVVNLVAILHGTPKAFQRAHVELPRRIAEACRAAGIGRLVHVSALGVEPAPQPSDYLRSKAEGERALRAVLPSTTLLRPSVIFGDEDRLLNVFEQLQRYAPVVPLACADAQFQPVWVGDVARAIETCLEQPRTAGRTYECAGRDRLTLRELVNLAGRRGGVARPIIGLPLALARLQAAVLQCLPGEPLMSQDNLRSMQRPNVASGAVDGLASLGIEPRSIHEFAGVTGPRSA